MGAGVPRPVQPKSHMQRKAAANPKTDGIAASHLHEVFPAASTSKPSQPGKSQNQRAKKAAPTTSEAAAVTQLPTRLSDGFPWDCARFTRPSHRQKSCAVNASTADTQGTLPKRLRFHFSRRCKLFATFHCLRGYLWFCSEAIRANLRQSIRYNRVDADRLRNSREIPALL